MSYIGTSPVGGIIRSEFFSGDGSTTTFNLTYSYGSEASLLVFISGVKQKTNTYSLLSGQLIFSSPPTSGSSNIEVIYLSGSILTALASVANTNITGLIKSTQIANVANTQVTGTIITAQIADGSVTAAKLAAGAALPSQTSNGTYYLTTDGTNAIWKAQTQLTVASTQITGSMNVAQGGTGSSSLTANSIVTGNGTGAVTLVAPGTAGNVLYSNGTNWYSTALASVSSTIPSIQVFTSSGTFTVPAGVTKVRVYVTGGGGGGSYVAGCANYSGGTGGTSSFGPYASATGGGGGSAGNSPATGGTGSGGDLNMQGGYGLPNNGSTGGAPGGSFFGLSYGRGGTTGNFNEGYGAGGGTAMKIISGLTPGNTVTVTVGAVGSGGSGATAGIVVVEY